MKAVCAQVGPFADGELSAAAADLFRRHLGTCQTCPADLEQILVLDTLAQEALAQPARQLRTIELPACGVLPPPELSEVSESTRSDQPRAPAPATKTHLFSWKLPRLRMLTWFQIAAAGIGIFVVVRSTSWTDGISDRIRRRFGLEASAPQLAALEAPRCRSILGRYADPRYAQPVPCRIARSAVRGPLTTGPTANGQGNLPISQQMLARLQQQQDHRALAAVYLNDGDLLGAEMALGQAGQSVAVNSDRAVVALERGRFAEALQLAEAVLAASPDWKPAMWNRAVALQGLGRRADAARQFSTLAAGGEAGWSEEARRRAAALSDSATVKPGSAP